MLTINERPPAFASRAVGIVEGRLALTPANGENTAELHTDDGTAIPCFVQTKARQTIMADMTMLTSKVRCLAYPRTRRTLLELAIVDVELVAEGERSPQNDLFLIQGMNIGSRRPGYSQIGIRPNQKSHHKFERFWLTLKGHLTDNLNVVYQVRAVRKGRRLFIVESDPQLPKQCSPKRVETPRERARTIIRR
jgi:hypothetical protein